MPNALEQKTYSSFNFLVELDGQSIGGFQDVSGLENEVIPADHREASARDGRLSGRTKAAGVTLKRGLMSAEQLFKWRDQTGAGSPVAGRTMTISWRTEGRPGQISVRSWKLENPRFARLTHGPLNPGKREVAIELAVVNFERLELG